MKIALCYLLLPLLVAGSVATVFFLLAPGQDRVTKQAFESLRVGMTLHEAERLLGKPVRRMEVKKRDGTVIRGCFYENLPGFMQNEVAGITLQFIRRSGDDSEGSILQSKLFVKNTQSLSLLNRFENVWIRANRSAGAMHSKPDEMYYEESP